MPPDLYLLFVDLHTDLFSSSLSHQREEDNRFNDSSYMYALRHTVAHLCQALTPTKDGATALDEASVHGSRASAQVNGITSALKDLLLNISVWEAAHGKAHQLH